MPRFQGVQPDHVRVESPFFCFGFKRKADNKLFKVRSVDPDCPLSDIIPKKKEIKYQLRNKSANRPDINTERFKNVFVNRLNFRHNL